MPRAEAVADMVETAVGAAIATAEVTVEVAAGPAVVVVETVAEEEPPHQAEMPMAQPAMETGAVRNLPVAT